MKLYELLDRDHLPELVDEGYIRVQHHPSAPLMIFNYTHKAQYDRHWCKVTETCRGLIVHSGTDEIVARPFPKFFNLGETEDEIPDESFVAYEKLDGSLGISYVVPGTDQVAIATRGSFDSSQARRATEILHRDYPRLVPNLLRDRDITLCFEILLPENRIVVDYGGREQLVLLAAFETASGLELGRSELESLGYTSGPEAFALPKVYHYLDLADAVTAIGGPEWDNEEGVVLRFRSGYRAKLKTEEYVRLHRLLTGATPRKIWQMLKDGSPPITPLITNVPPSFKAWVEGWVERIRDDFHGYEQAAQDDFANLSVAGLTTDRKRFAQAVAPSPLRAILFKLLDEQPYDEIIWKMIKPEAANPFYREEAE